MRRLILTIIIVFSVVAIPMSTHAMTWIDGYWSGGTWVEGHYRTEADSYEWNDLGSDGVDLDNDGYGAGAVNDLYDYNENDVYDGYEYDSYDYDTYDPIDSYDTYDSYDYDSGFDTYDSYDYDSYDYDSGLDSYDYDTGYDSYDYDYGW